MAGKIGYGIITEIEELELDYVEHDYMRSKGHKRSHGTSRNLKVVVTSQLVLFDMVKVVKRNFMSLGLVYFQFHSIIFIHDQMIETEHHSWFVF